MTSAETESTLRASRELDLLYQSILDGSVEEGVEWETMIRTSTAYSNSLKTTSGLGMSFLQSFMHLADTASHSIGATSELGRYLKDLLNMQMQVQEVISKTFADFQKFLTPLKMIETRNKTTTKTLAKAYDKILASETSEMKKLEKQLHQKHPDPKTPEQMKTRAREIQKEKRELVEKLLIEQRKRYCEVTGLYLPIVRQEVLAHQAADDMPNLLRKVSEQSLGGDTLPQLTKVAIDQRLEFGINGENPQPVGIANSMVSRLSTRRQSRRSSDENIRPITPTTVVTSDSVRGLFALPASAAELQRRRVPSLLGSKPEHVARLAEEDRAKEEAQTNELIANIAAERSPSNRVERTSSTASRTLSMKTPSIHELTPANSSSNLPHSKPDLTVEETAITSN